MELRARMAAGTLTPETFVWTPGMTDWLPAAQVAALGPLFQDEEPVGPNTIPDAVNFGQFILGTWVQEGMMPAEGVGLGSGRLASTFNADKTCAIQGAIQVTIEGQALQVDIQSTGTYIVTSGPGGTYSVQWTGQLMAGVPALNIAPVSEPFNESSIVTIVDQNTLRDTDGILLPAPPVSEPSHPAQGDPRPAHLFPGTAMVFVWSSLTRGDATSTLVQVSVIDVIMVFAPRLSWPFCPA